MKILGSCFGVEIFPREEYGPLVQILSEDDGNWFRSKESFDAYWLDDLINVLQQAKHYVENNFDRNSEGYFNTSRDGA